MYANTNERVDPVPHMKIALDLIFTKMSANTGFKRYGETTIDEMVKEFTQLNEGLAPGKPVVVLTDARTLTDLDKEKVLCAVSLIKEKWNGMLKGRSCVDVSKQRKYLKQDEHVASPTAALEYLFTTVLIDVCEERDVGTCDVPGENLQARLIPKEKIKE